MSWPVPGGIKGHEPSHQSIVELCFHDVLPTYITCRSHRPVPVTLCARPYNNLLL